MINITKLNDKQVVINCELIEMIEANPDTTITMNTGRKIIVRESVEEIISRTVTYKKEIFSGGR